MKNTSTNHSQLLQISLLPKRIDKALEWLKTSRDDWKDKCLIAKSSLKIKTLSVKRLRKGRDIWRQQAKKAALTIQEIKDEIKTYVRDIAKLKKELEFKDSQIEDLKKKL